jgi:CRP-like cAMP-binding protein
MYVVNAGSVTITKQVGEVEKILSRLGPGEFLGEMAILNNRPRSATAICAEDCRLLVIDAKTFETMIRSNSEIAVRLIKKLSDRLAEANEQIENLLLTDAASRVVHWLAVTAERGTAAGMKIDMAPRDLAARVGVKPDQADEALMKLLKAKIVSVHPDGFVVADLGKLHHFLEFLQMKAQFGDVE